METVDDVLGINADCSASVGCKSGVHPGIKPRKQALEQAFPYAKISPLKGLRTFNIYETRTRCFSAFPVRAHNQLHSTYNLRVFLFIPL
jgi:hypothetical protein